MNVYEIVSEKILTQLQAGTIPWLKPWTSPRGAYNTITGKSYSLLNQMLLLEKGPGAYASYDQWTKLGGRIKKGEHGSMIVFWKLQEIESDDGQNVKRPVLRYYKIFHQSQVAGVTVDDPEEMCFSTEPIEAVEDLLMSYINRERIRYEEVISNKAYYSPQKDLIHVPDKRQFERPEAFYSTLAHECGHSTGAVSRLNRKGLQDIQFGSETYSYEELIAELTSAFILNSIGIDTEATVNNSAAYIAGWTKALQDDSHLIVRAAGQAEKAANLIKGEAK